jgi:polysaccharide biosynthesis/export protein
MRFLLKAIKRGLCAGALLPVALSLAFGQSAIQKQPPKPTPSSVGDAASKASASGGPIGVGDLIDLSLFTSPATLPEFTEKARVGSDGTIHLPLLGAMHVAGSSVEGAESAISNLYLERGIYKQVQVNLVVVEYGVQHSISISGEVQKPGIYPMNGPMHLVDAIAVAGGVTSRTGQHIAIEHADSSVPTQVVQVQNGASAPGQNPSLSGGDKVIVERAGVVYVVGDVNKPGGYVMDNTGNLSVLQALALAGGAAPTAALNSCKLIRTTPKGREESSLHLKKILTSQMADPYLQADDIIFVPASAAKTVGKRTIDAILQTATGMAIYGRY